jgi:hypothetical protein
MLYQTRMLGEWVSCKQTTHLWRRHSATHTAKRPLGWLTAGLDQPWRELCGILVLRKSVFQIRAIDTHNLQLVFRDDGYWHPVRSPQPSSIQRRVAILDVRWLLRPQRRLVCLCSGHLRHPVPCLARDLADHEERPATFSISGGNSDRVFHHS